MKRTKHEHKAMLIYIVPTKSQAYVSATTKVDPKC